MQHVWGIGEVHARVSWGDVRVGDYLQDPGIKGSSRSGMGGMERIDLTQDRDGCRALVNAVMNLVST
jgi:hypothetical protein